jgi:hypothetical protein
MRRRNGCVSLAWEVGDMMFVWEDGCRVECERLNSGLVWLSDGVVWWARCACRPVLVKKLKEIGYLGNDHLCKYDSYPCFVKYFQSHVEQSCWQRPCVLCFADNFLHTISAGRWHIVYQSPAEPSKKVRCWHADNWKCSCMPRLAHLHTGRYRSQSVTPSLVNFHWHWHKIPCVIILTGLNTSNNPFCKLQ